MSLDRLKELFESKGFVVNNLFVKDGFYKFAEIVNFKNATSLIVLISDKHKIPAEGSGKHEYTLVKKEIGETQERFSNDANIRSSYQEIDHISRALETEADLTELYDKPISIKGEETRSKEKFLGTIAQLRRFKLCVRNIPYKFVLFDDDCVCLLNSDSDIESYYITDYTHKKRKIFISVSLENFYEASSIEKDVLKITEQFYDILNTNQKIETTKIQNMIDAKRNVVVQSNRILEIKKKLFEKIKKLQSQHHEIVEKITSAQQKLKGLRSSSSNDTATRANIIKFTQDIEKYNEQQHDIVKTIIETRKELDEVCLVVDNILFDNMVMLSQIAHNFKVLEMLKTT